MGVLEKKLLQLDLNINLKEEKLLKLNFKINFKEDNRNICILKNPSRIIFSREVF